MNENATPDFEYEMERRILFSSLTGAAGMRCLCRRSDVPAQIKKPCDGITVTGLVSSVRHQVPDVVPSLR